MSATVKKLSWQESDIPEDVRAFCRARDVTADLRLAVELLLRSFPEAEEVLFRLEADADTGGQWAVVRVLLRGRCPQAFARHRECVRLLRKQGAGTRVLRCCRSIPSG